MVETVEVKGLRDLDLKLSRLGEVAGKKALRGAMMDAASPIWKAARENASSIKDSGALAAAMGRWFKQFKKNQFAVFIGPRSKSRKGVQLWTSLHGREPKGGRLRHAHLVEFGTRKDPAQPFLRPAFDANWRQAAQIFARRLRERINKIAKVG